MYMKRAGVVFVFLVVGATGYDAAAKPPRRDKNGPTAAPVQVAPPAQAATPTADPVFGDMSELETRRMIEHIKAKFPEQKTKFKELCGTDVNIDVDFASFSRDKGAYESLASNYGVDRIIESFRKICQDKLGKDAVKAKIKTLRAVNVRDKESIKVFVEGGRVTAMLNWSGGFSPGRNESEIAADIMKAL